ncbi:MAG: dihydroorotate dehydrogenase electron transfer subunit [Ruthenibacterium sp.]
MPAANFNATVLENTPLGDSIFLLRAAYNAIAPAPCAGQFFMLRAWKADEAPLLSRPISVHDYDAKKGEITFLYEQRGLGTEKIAALKAGDLLQLTGPAGNGFPLEKCTGKVALVGGGIGIAPLLLLAKVLAEKGATVDFYAGFRDIPYRADAFAAVCNSVNIATDSGKAGHKGFVTELLMPENYDVICTCGPEIMMQKVAKMCLQKGTAVYVSKEAKMACGIGACLGCTCKSKHGGVSVCKDGPVFEGGVFYALD